MKRIAIALVIVAALAACSKKEAPAPTVAVDQQAAQKQKYDLPPDHPMIGTQNGPMGAVTSTAMPGQEMPAGHAGAMGEARPAEGMPKISGKVLEATVRSTGIMSDGTEDRRVGSASLAVVVDKLTQSRKHRRLARILLERKRAGHVA